MQVIIQPSTISGTVAAPPSKSATQRAFAAALLTGGISRISSAGSSNDDKAALNIIQQLGAVVSREPRSTKSPDFVALCAPESQTSLKPKQELSNSTASSVEEVIFIDSRHSFLSQPTTEEITNLDCSESGLSIRMFTPIASLKARPVRIEGQGSLRTRPMDFFDAVLPQLDVKIATNGGKLPLHVQGPLVPQNITVDGALSSQFLTGLLMAYAAAGASDVAITVTNLKSRPYINLTLQVMQDFGLPVPVNENHERFYFPKREIIKRPVEIAYTVEGDWSNGAFLLVAGAISGGITVQNLKIDSAQADKKIMEALQDCGAVVTIANGVIEVQPALLQSFHFDATDCPDLFPPLVALAAYCSGNTTIKGVSRLASKESNRGLTLQQQFGKMGVDIFLDNDTMTVMGGKPLQGAAVHSCHDHRIAMACAVAALQAAGETTIGEAEAVNKSYPDFYRHLHQLGVAVSGY